MNPLEASLRRIASELTATGKPWALVGGLAVSARAEPRTTRDVDIVVSVSDDAEAEGLIAALQARGYRVTAVVEQDATGRLAAVRLETADDTGGLVDLLFASSGIEHEVSRAAEPIEILPGLTIPVARLGHLIGLKILARDDRTRPQDFDDLRALLSEAGPDDIDLARRSLEDIEAGGYHRSRALLSALEATLDELTERG